MGERVDYKQEQAELFAVRIVKLTSFLRVKNEFVMSKQLLRSGTSIGANVAEANFAESDSDFVHKLAIARKEANETAYWLRLVCKTGHINQEQFESIYSDCQKMIGLLTKIILSKQKETS